MSFRGLNKVIKSNNTVTYSNIKQSSEVVTAEVGVCGEGLCWGLLRVIYNYVLTTFHPRYASALLTATLNNMMINHMDLCTRLVRAAGRF